MAGSEDCDAKGEFAKAIVPLFRTAKRGFAQAQVSNYYEHYMSLRRRFLNAGGVALADDEMLELVLFRAIPHKDVKPVARELIETFGDFAGALSAPPTRLAEVQGVGDAVVTELKIVAAAAERLARVRVMHAPVLAGWQALIDYCRTAMAHRTTEQFRVLFLDRKNRLIADEAHGEGTVDHVPVYPRKVVKRALELDASALILVHNHPSGDPTPSEADIAMTVEVEQAARTVGIELYDHVVVGKAREASFRTLALI